MKRLLRLLSVSLLLIGTMAFTSMAETFSSAWFEDASGWHAKNASGELIRNAWFCDDAVPGNGQNVWYLLDPNGQMLSAGLVQDGTGNFYSIETNHNGYFGMLRYKNGTYDCNGQQVYLEFEQTHGGSFGAIRNADGLEKLKAIYGVTSAAHINNSNCVYTSGWLSSSAKKTSGGPGGSGGGGGAGGGGGSSSGGGGGSHSSGSGSGSTSGEKDQVATPSDAGNFASETDLWAYIVPAYREGRIDMDEAMEWYKDYYIERTGYEARDKDALWHVLNAVATSFYEEGKLTQEQYFFINLNHDFPNQVDMGFFFDLTDDNFYFLDEYYLATSQNTDIEEAEKRMFELINEFREFKGYEPLEYFEPLHHVAHDRAEEVLTKRGHRSCGDLYEKYGIEYSKYWRGHSEINAYNNRTLADLLRNWISDSDGAHYSILIQNDDLDAGVGLSFDSEIPYYWYCVAHMLKRK